MANLIITAGANATLSISFIVLQIMRMHILPCESDILVFKSVTFNLNFFALSISISKSIASDRDEPLPREWSDVDGRGSW